LNVCRTPTILSFKNQTEVRRERPPTVVSALHPRRTPPSSRNWRSAASRRADLTSREALEFRVELEFGEAEVDAALRQNGGPPDRCLDYSEAPRSITRALIVAEEAVLTPLLEFGFADADIRQAMAVVGAEAINRLRRFPVARGARAAGGRPPRAPEGGRAGGRKSSRSCSASSRQRISARSNSPASASWFASPHSGSRTRALIPASTPNTGGLKLNVMGISLPVLSLSPDATLEAVDRKFIHNSQRRGSSARTCFR
jgi:hypothetical protein